MALVHHNNLGVYSGVSTQAIDLRLDNHCEEMVNCYPTIENGTRRRNPTQQLSNSIIVEKNQFQHTYDRGLSGETSEQYLITIDAVNNLRVFDIQANEYRTVTYSGNALQYLQSANPEIGFSAMTVKDATFIANRDIIPQLLPNSDYTVTSNYGLSTFDMTGYAIESFSSFEVIKTVAFSRSASKLEFTLSALESLAPARLALYNYTGYLYPAPPSASYAISAVGAVFTITVNAIEVKYTVNTRSDGINTRPETMSEARINIANAIRTALGDDYYVVIGINGEIYVYNVMGDTVSISVSIDFPTSVNTVPPVTKAVTGWSKVGEDNYGVNPITISYGTGDVYVKNIDDYDKKAFIWIQQVSPDTAFPYTFTVTLKESSGTTIASTTSNATTSTAVASAIASWATGLADFTASSDGSVVLITRDSGTAFEISVTDTYGDQASSAWKGSVSTMSDMPKSFPFKDTIVRVEGIERDEIGYWVKYDGNQWVEWRDPNMNYRFDTDTMPHQLVRNSDFTFTLKAVEWKDIMVGDEDTQDIPEFVTNGIRDLFFIGGRMGVLSRNGITLSQQGDFSNFFRTTVLSLLDDSAITTYIDSSKSVGLEYASELQGNIIFFGDKLQFALDGSRAISPSTISIQPISGFEINKNVRPISIGDSVFFVVSKSGYSALMEMNKSSLSQNIRAVDVSAHVQGYIDSDIMYITASQRDNAIFMRSRTKRDTIYVYKHFGTETEKVQMAWSKWVFSMDINSIFVFDKELYLFGERLDSTVPLDEYSLVSVWDDSKLWLDETKWVDTNILTTPSFEKIDIDSYGVDASFLDNGTVRYNSEVNLSEWMLQDSSKQKELRGSLLIKTAEVSSAIGSEFYLIVNDLERGTERAIPSVYTVNRKPFISGNAKNMRVSIASVNGKGFQINAISLEGQYNVRSKRV